MRNPIKRLFKGFQPLPTPRDRVVMTIGQLVDAMFPALDGSQKLKLILAGTGTVYACVNLIADSCAMETPRLYTENMRGGDSTRKLNHSQKAYFERRFPTKSVDNIEEVTEHPALKLLWKPNPRQTQVAFNRLTWEHEIQAGDCFLYLPRLTETSEPQEINVLPVNTEIVEKKGRNELGNEYFREIDYYRLGNTHYPPYEIIHYVYAYDPEKIWTYGKSPLQSVVNEYNISGHLKANLEDRAKTKFGSEVIIEKGEKSRYTDDQMKQIKEQIKAYRSGNVNADQIMMLESGDKLVGVPLADKDLPYDSNLKFLMERICNAYKVPVSMFTESSTRSVQSTQDKQYLSYCITPRLKHREEDLNYFYLPMFKNTEGMYFAYDSVVPEDDKLQAEIHERLIRVGVMTPNEVRYERNLDALPDGDQLYMDSSLMPVGMPVGMTVEDEAKALIDGVVKAMKGDK